MRVAAALAMLLLAAPLAAEAEGSRVPEGYVAMRGGDFTTALRYEDRPGRSRIAPFALMQRPVTNAQFRRFVQAHPHWRRDRVPRALAEARYLSHWEGPLQPGDAAQDARPVTWVSWFAADAYCQAQGARLPTWGEWEYAAAADETRADARGDRAFRERILAWYARPSDTPLPRAGLQAPNVHGVQDLHGLVWEWTEDFSSLLVSADNRQQGDAGRMEFCGAGALSMDDRENYAVLMRVAMLSSLGAADATANLGFRCARDLP
ncbi:MAG: hypothetical protein A2579_03155 [Lysobacterales bacterium RIFOXYD1_FULL_69_11]|nr:MAG: hypothetical protein A2190_10110 [Xanthomonadales bacterium RIFOXYA1_FULL_69_10]OHE87478.1 MAG: hypothetical protein A2579_03155 [Xanthomonadales bacterium RIFOXYD1_FULL_69_11]